MMNNWISVKERLPGEAQSVLCVVNGKPSKNITLCGALEIGAYFDDGWLIDEFPDWDDPNVTHWMPLPEPPEQKENHPG